jgi:hypothetical protein
MTTPVWSPADRQIFLSAAYDGGTRVIQLRRANGKPEARQLWYSNKVRVHFNNVLRVGDYYYGSSGDFGPTFLTAVHAKTRAIAWQDRTFLKANLLRVRDRVILLDEDGTLALATFTPERLTVHARAAVATATSWTAPELVGTTLYLRDRVSIMALDLAPR